MKDRNDNCQQRTAGERGVSIVEVLIVVVMISIVAAFAVMKIGAAQRSMRLNNSAREFAAWLERARLDSVRRHAMSNSEMAKVQITSANSYSITIDQNGDGTLDPARTFTLPGTNGAQFTGISTPSTIYYNWRGRPVDSAGNPVSITFSLTDAIGTTPVVISLSGGGDATLGGSANVSTVTVSSVNTTSNIRPKTY